MGNKKNSSRSTLESTDANAASASQFAPPQSADQDDGAVLEALRGQVEALEAQLTEGQAQVEALKDQYVRAQAEMENIRTRARRDGEQMRARAIQSFADGLLPVADSLEQALENCKDDHDSTQALKEGVELTLQMLMGALEKLGITAIDPTGEAFDPNFHEAMSTVPEGGEPGSVLQVFQKGYLLKERLIRPARVIVVQS